MVSIDTMNTQVNVRLPDNLLASAKKYAKEKGFGTVQELIKETLREEVCEEDTLSKKELKLVKRIIQVSEKYDLYGTEEDLFKALRRK